MARRLFTVTAVGWRSSIVVISLLCVAVCIWLFVSARRASEQRRIVEAIEAAGGKVRYAYECSKLAGPPPPYLARLVFGVDFCANVAEVIFPEGTATDSAMKWVSGLTHLELLGIDHSRITDVGLEHVASLRTLTVLSLCGTGVTDAGMKSLGGLAHLHRLDLDRTNVTDTGLKELIGLNELYSLSVCGTRVTEIGLAKLGCLPRLRAVTISVGCAGCMDRRKVERALPQCRIFGQDEKGALRLPSEDW